MLQNRNRFESGRPIRGAVLPAALLALALLVPAAAGQEAQEDGLRGGPDLEDYASDASPGIEEKLGDTIPLDLTFTNEEGETVILDECIDRPTILLLVYLRCASICSPIMHEVARTVDKLEMEAGKDFNLLTVSFDMTDTPGIAKTGKANLLDSMEKRIPPASWRFLTGGPKNITALTKAVGFRFRREKEDFVHAGTVIFLSAEGKIVRYLPGLSLLPADVKMALVDAAEGRPRSLMTKLQRLCYSYDPEGKTYVFQVNRIVLFATLFGLALFLAYILLKRKKVAKEEGVS